MIIIQPERWLLLDCLGAMSLRTYISRKQKYAARGSWKASLPFGISAEGPVCTITAS